MVFFVVYSTLLNYNILVTSPLTRFLSTAVGSTLSVEGEQRKHAEYEQPGVGQQGPLLLDWYVLCFQAHGDEARGDSRAPEDGEEGKRGTGYRLPDE